LRVAVVGLLHALSDEPPVARKPRVQGHCERTWLDIDAGRVWHEQALMTTMNREWDKFFKGYPDAGREQILRQMRRLRKDPRFQ